MLRPLVDTLARCVLATRGSVAAWIVAVAVAPAMAQNISGSGVTVSTYNVPQIVVPRINVQVQTARVPASASTSAGSWAVSAPSEPEAGEENPDNPQADGLQPLVSRPIGSRTGNYQKPTGILQLVSAAEPVDPTIEPTSPLPPPVGTPQPNDPPSLQWTNPYETGPTDGPVATGWHRLVPLGILPWGPRTPLAQRAVGWGQPLLGTSWNNRPWSAGCFAGMITGSPLIHGAVNQMASFYGGYRVGFDYDFYWGLEGRLGASSICLSEPDRIGQPGTNDYWNLDMNLHYYPWGDSVWRPYASFGIGMANFAFYDQNNNHYDQVEFATPIGVGVKYRWTNWVAFRADVSDNVAYARGAVATTNNLSVTAGVEMRFGGVRRSYWPWNPGRVIR
ncbi:MAG TPA: outer membrane beta-barrel protein [Pirellulales bacterium]|nr:outer membrane beta-barrel protein [Pirellulales bacterium]